MQEGKVVEQGSHEHLMQQRGLYYELWTTQEMGSSSSLVSKAPENGGMNGANGHDPKKLKQNGKPWYCWFCVHAL